MDTNTLPAPVDIDALLREAEVIQFIDYPRLIALADEIVGAALRADLPLKAAEALTHRAWGCAHLGDSEGALRAALDALIVAREHRALRVEHLALRSLGVVFERGGLPDETLRLLELMQKIVTQLGDVLLQASTLNNTAVIEMTRDPLRAVKILQSALAILPADERGDTRRVVISWNLAKAMGLAGQLDTAMPHAEEALRVARKIGARIWAGRAQVIMAFVAGLRGEFEAAHGFLEAVEPEMIMLEAPVLTGEYHYQHGMLLTEEGRFDEAVGALEDAYQVTLDHDIVNLQIDILKALAQCYERLNDMPGVVSTYKRMTDGVVKQQQRGAELRFAVMKTALDINRASVEAQARVNQFQANALHKLSHEFRTPLAVIKSSASMVAQYGDRISPEATRARLEEITTQVKWMTVMMDDIAELLQPDSGDFPIRPFTLDVLTGAVLADVAQYQLDTTRVAVETGGSVSATLQGTYDALRRTLVQLLTNALKFSDHAVRMRLDAEAGELVASVSDAGVGIPAGEQALVLRPMYRASNSGEVTGTGLGLALVDKLVKGAGAAFDLESAEGSGTTVTVRWPLR